MTPHHPPSTARLASDLTEVHRRHSWQAESRPRPSIRNQGVPSANGLEGKAVKPPYTGSGVALRNWRVYATDNTRARSQLEGLSSFEYGVQRGGKDRPAHASSKP